MSDCVLIVVTVGMVTLGVVALVKGGTVEWTRKRLKVWGKKGQQD